jgi:hypothetical protein
MRIMVKIRRFVSLMQLYTYDDRNVHVRLLKWVGAGLRANDDDAMQGCPEDGDVSVPPEGALLPGHVEPVGESRVWLDWTLCYHIGSIGPTR